MYKINHAKLLSAMLSKGGQILINPVRSIVEGTDLGSCGASRADPCGNNLVALHASPK